MARTMPLVSLLLAGLLLLLPACELFGQDDAPRFAPGEYGGDALVGTENLSNLVPSPGGERIALVRKRTPGVPSDPRYQLWIVERDGSNARLISVNTGTVDWSPDGKRLAVTVIRGIESYIYTIDLATNEVKQWTGHENDVISKPTATNPVWFQDGERLLISVSAKAYQQPFERGIYTINTEREEVKGPLAEVMQSSFLGNNDQFATGKKYTGKKDPRSGNFVRYDFATDEWHWITDFSEDRITRIAHAPVPSPISRQLVQSRKTGNAWQLFLMNSEGKNVQQVTELGGDNPHWSSDGSYFTFTRDVHKGRGARYVPFKFDLEAMEAEPLFPSQPDSLPDFPPLSEAPTLAASTSRLLQQLTFVRR